MLKTSHWCRFHPFHLSFSSGCDLNARVFWWVSWTSARHAGSFDCLMTSLILITMDNGRGRCAYWQSCKVPNQTHRGMKKNRKMYAIKQIKICAEYRDMLPRPRLDLSGTPGLRPIGLSPGSWQTSLGLGSMSRYSAQILICITFSALLALCAGNSPVPVNSPHKGQLRGALTFSLICAWIIDWVNNREAGDLRRHRGHYDVIVMLWWFQM